MKRIITCLILTFSLHGNACVFHGTQLPKKGKPRKNDVFTGFNLK